MIVYFLKLIQINDIIISTNAIINKNQFQYEQLSRLQNFVGNNINNLECENDEEIKLGKVKMKQIFYEINSTWHHIEFLLNYYVKRNRRINTTKVWHYLPCTNKVINLNQTSNEKKIMKEMEYLHHFYLFVIQWRNIYFKSETYSLWFISLFNYHHRIIVQWLYIIINMLIYSWYWCHITRSIILNGKIGHNILQI